MSSLKRKQPFMLCLQSRDLWKFDFQSTSSTTSSSFSNYFYKLEPNVKARYVEKISLCDGIDPYTMNKNSFLTDFRELPNLEFPDI